MCIRDRDSGVALDDPGAYAAQGFQTQGQRSYIQQQQVLDLASQYTALNGSAHGNTLIGVDALEGVLAHVVLDSVNNGRDTGGTAYQQHLVDLGGLQAGIGQSLTRCV